MALRNVVIVDDEPELLASLRDILPWEDYGFQILGTAASALEAERLLAAAPCDLLITDIRMPGKNGLELIQSIQGLYPSLKTIVVSAFDDFEFIRGALRLGVVDYVLKPVDSHEFAEIILKLAEGYDIQDRSGLELPSADTVFQEHFLHRWLHGSIASYELEERFQMARIGVEDSRFAVCMIRILSAGSIPQDRIGLSLKEALLRELPRVVASYQYRESDLLYAAVLIVPRGTAGADTGIDAPADALGPLMRHVVQRLAKAYGMESFIGLGPLVEDAQQVPASYLSSRHFVEYSLIRPGNTVVEAGEFSPVNGTYDLVSRIDFDALSAFIIDGDAEGAETYIGKLLGMGDEDSGQSSWDVRVLVSEILIQIGRTVNCSKSACPLPLDDYLEELERIKSRKDFAPWLHRLIRDAIAILKESRENLSPMIRHVILDIRTRIGDKNLCLKSLAGDLNLTPTYLGQLFRQETDELFTTYLTGLRIREAKRFLNGSDYRIHEIADIVGFANHSYFNKVFKKATGITPVDYRRGNDRRIMPDGTA